MNTRLQSIRAAAFRLRELEPLDDDEDNDSEAILHVNLS